MALILTLIFVGIVLLSLIWILLVAYLMVKKASCARNLHNVPSGRSSKLVAFFHPFCNAAGGGERVLWQALKILHSEYPDHSYVIYSDNYEVDSAEILRKASKTFQINIDFQVHLVKLTTCSLLSPSLYPFFTILFQNLGSMIVGFEALWKCPPDVLIDTTGASFIYPLFKYFGLAKTCAYVHYPTISVDMLNLVENNVANFNNREFIARNSFLSKLKLVYYKVFAQIYKLTGKCLDVTMANSSWTRNHILEIWKVPVTTVYPPCNTSNLTKLNLSDRDSNLIISMAQFRPEKNHKLQISAFSILLSRLQEEGVQKMPTLVIIGSCRNEGDRKRVEELVQMCNNLGIQEQVQFKVNLPYVEMEILLAKASIAIHTMYNEHFGISVVEFLASGLLTLTHNSAGPKLDIILENETGFFANDTEQFADILYRLVQLPELEAMAIRVKARQSVHRFSEHSFEQSFVQQVRPLF